MSRKVLRKLSSVALSGVLLLGVASVVATARMSVEPQEAHAAQKTVEVVLPAGTYTSKSDGVWKKSGARWWYQYNSGGYAKGWAFLMDSSKFVNWYFFDASGWMKTGWQKSGKNWFYLKSSGAMATGWQKVSGKWYYLDPRSGAMQTGWELVGGKWYYLDGSGAMKTGWLKSGNKWYYLSSSGVMATGWAKVSGKWYYLDGSGAMKTGWQKVSNKWYYMNGSGVMQANKWIGNYYLLGSGAMATNQWVGKYYVGADGKWLPNPAAEEKPAHVHNWVTETWKDPDTVQKIPASFVACGECGYQEETTDLSACHSCGSRMLAGISGYYTKTIPGETHSKTYCSDCGATK